MHGYRYHPQQRTDPREELVGNPSPGSLEEAVAKLAAASAICQLPNMELAPDVLKTRDGVLSCRPLVGSLLSDKSLAYLLGSRLFIDSGQHQVKLYPEQLLPYLAAKRLCSLVQSPEDSRRLISALSWRSATGECGVHRAYLTLAGWLATFNVHCRHDLLEVEPQAVAFFGDLRNPQVPLADAVAAIERTLKRLEVLGDSLGRNQFTLTAENYWQAAKPGIEPTLSELYDRVSADGHARVALLDIATYARLEVLRTKVLLECGHDYGTLLSHSAELVYVMSLGRGDDALALAAAAKANSQLEERALRLLLRELAWTYFDAETIAELAANSYLRRGGGFYLSWTLTQEVADAASADQLASLAEALLSQMVQHLETMEDAKSKRLDDFAEIVQELIALVVRRSALPVERAAELCLKYYKAHGQIHFGSVNDAELESALKSSSEVRQLLLKSVIALSDRTADGIWKTFSSFGLYSCLSVGDAEALAEPGLTELASTLSATAQVSRTTPESKKPRKDRLELDEATKAALLTQVDSVQDGTNTDALVWIAKWLRRTNGESRCGECDFSMFERAAGEQLAIAARLGLSAIWRQRAPTFKESEPRSTYYATIAGLQGLHLDLGDGTALPKLSDAEVRQALSYAHFEINGYPKWFWPVVRTHETVAAEEFERVLAASGDGVVSADKAVALIRHLTGAPLPVQRALSAPTWAYATSSDPVDSYALESALACALAHGGGVNQDTFQTEAWSRIQVAFRNVLHDLSSVTPPMNSEERAARTENETHSEEMTRLRANAVVWGLLWLLRYPATFGVKWESWRDAESSAAEEFMFDLAAFVGENRVSRLREIAQLGKDGLNALAALYEWVSTVVQEKDDPKHEDGRPYKVGARENAQRLRESLLPAIASAKTQAAYEVLNALRDRSSGVRAKYIRFLQFQMREEEAFVPPVAQRDYPRFERDFAPPVTEFIAFAQAVHNDLLAVKRDIEHGEFSLRRLFNSVVMQHIKTDTEGLALEEDFQALLGSELNHASGGRYGVALEPILPAATKRDVLCQLGELRATVELKMSARWTVQDYLSALDDQLKKQYLQAPNSKIGFLVIVLQHKKQWDNPTGGKLDFDGLIRLLEARALELQSAEPALFLRIVGIDATPQADFRAVQTAKKARGRGAAKYADQAGNTWHGKGRRPQWLKDAIAAGKQLEDFLSAASA